MNDPRVDAGSPCKANVAAECMQIACMLGLARGFRSAQTLGVPLDGTTPYGVPTVAPGR